MCCIYLLLISNGFSDSSIAYLILDTEFHFHNQVFLSNSLEYITSSNALFTAKSLILTLCKLIKAS
ncbi:TPA: hypothetical protein DEG21_05910 [Patescibacteria group bacterium]|nr:hypothetical protein [Candidatus Gracilibacteria bacterium]